MTKSIEEAAREHRASINRMGEVAREHEMNGYATAVRDMFRLPLASRLTPDEKSIIRQEYAKTYPDDIDRGVTNICIGAVLERVFGKEFFKKE